MKIKNVENVNSYLISSAVVGNLNSIDNCISNGGNVNYINSEGVSVLMAACSRGNVDAAKRLIEYGADVNYYSKKMYKSVLMDSHDDCLELLLSNGANVNTPNRIGNTILMMRLFSAAPSMENFELFIKYGADLSYKNKNGDSLYELALNTQDSQVMATYEYIKMLSEKFESEKAFEQLNNVIENKQDMTTIVF